MVNLRATFNTRSDTFAGFRFPPDVILLACAWYLRYGLSYRDVEEWKSPGLTDGVGVGICRMGGFVVGGAEAFVVAVASGGVVPAFDPFEYGAGELVSGVPVVLVREFSLQDREKRLCHRIVETVADAAH